MLRLIKTIGTVFTQTFLVNSIITLPSGLVLYFVLYHFVAVHSYVVEATGPSSVFITSLEVSHLNNYEVLQRARNDPGPC